MKIMERTTFWLRRFSPSALFAWVFFSLVSPGFSQTEFMDSIVAGNDSHLTLLGRYDARGPAHPRFGYPGSGFVFRFQGPSLQIDVDSTSEASALTIVVDHGAPKLQLLHRGSNSVQVHPEVRPEGVSWPHTVEVYKRTETWQGIITLLGIRLPNGTTLLLPPPQPTRKLMFIGDSVTCGEGIDNNDRCEKDPTLPSSNAYESYGMLLGRRLDAQTHLVCYGGRGLVRDYRGLGEKDGVLNAPQFFQLAIASDDLNDRAPWDTSRWQPAAILVSIGTNDFNLQKTKPLDEKNWVDTYAGFVRALRHNYPKAIIFLTEGAIVTDPLLPQLLQQTVAKVHNKKVRYASSQHYPGNGCNGHPTGIQHVHMADDFERILRRNLGW